MSYDGGSVSEGRCEGGDGGRGEGVLFIVVGVLVALGGQDGSVTTRPKGHGTGVCAITEDL